MVEARSGLGFSNGWEKDISTWFNISEVADIICFSHLQIIGRVAINTEAH